MNSLFRSLRPLCLCGEISLPALKIFNRKSAIFNALCLCGLLLLTGCTKSARFERHVTRGDAAYAKEDFEAARIEYMNALRLKPDDPHVISRLGIVSLESGEIQAAAEFLRAARQLQPTNLEVRVKFGFLLAAAGQSSNALAEAEYVLAQVPAHGEAFQLLAAAVATTNQLGAALERLQAILPTNATNARLHLALAQLEQKAGDADAAIKALQRARQLDPGNPRPSLALGTLLWGRGDTNGAEANYKKAAELAPPDSVETLRFADFKIKTGRYEEGRALLERAIKEEPGFLAGLNALAELAFLERKTNECSAYLAQALKADPKNRDALLTRARLKLLRRDISGAILDLETLAAAGPRDAMVHYQLALAHRANNDPIKALATLDRTLSVNTNFIEGKLLQSEILLAAGNAPAAVSGLTALAERYPGIPRIHLLLAAAHRQRGAPADALAAYSRMIESFPKDPQPHYLAALVLRQQNQLPRARQALQAALELAPDYLQAIDELIELDIVETNFPAALGRIQFYIEKYPDKPMPRLLQAKVFAAERRHADAFASLEKAIEIEPEFYPAHRAMAQLYIESGQREEAIGKFEELRRKNPRDAGALLQLALLYEAGSEFAAAREAYEQLLDINPNSVPALNNLAYLLSERVGDAERAFALARKARELAPYDPFSADTFGWIAYKKGEYQQALSAIQQAVDRLPNEPEVQFHFGMAHYMNGNQPEALNALQLAVSSTNEFRGKDLARASLAILQIQPASPQPGDQDKLQAAIQRNPSDFFAHYKLAQIHETEGAWTKAAGSYQSALQINPRASAALIAMARIHVEHLGLPQKGLEFARQAWFASQDNAAAAVLGRLAAAAGDFKWALPLLEQAHRADSANPRTVYYLALAAYAQARLNQARQMLATLPGGAEFPEAAEASLFARILPFHLDPAARGQAESAAASLLKINPRHPAALLASARLQESSPSAARSQLESLVQKYPDLVIAERALALLLADYKLNDAAAAAQLAKLRISLPNDPQVLKASGEIAYRRQDFREAVRYLTQAASQLPKDGGLFYHLGLAQHKLQDRGAKATLAQALALEASSPLAAEARQALSELN